VKNDRKGLLTLSYLIFATLAFGACRLSRAGVVNQIPRTEQFSFQVAAGKDQFQIEGYLALSSDSGRDPVLLILNPGGGDATRCIKSNWHLTELGIHVACISIPGYGESSGPSRYIGPQAVASARRALDLLVARPDVDSNRLGVWGLSNGAVVAGLVMDSDPRPRAVVLQSGAYDMIRFWPEATLLTKLAILHEVWPSSRVLKERSVIAHLPPKLGCRVLIMHGEQDPNTPVRQARRLEQELRARGAHVQTCYFPDARHMLGKRVDQPLEAFLRDNLVAVN
jgi:dipeptidyl aminopeptidase/acylaminoacyl peptidase